MSHEIKPGDWYAVRSMGDAPPWAKKLPTDPRTLLRVYRAAMKWRSLIKQGAVSAAEYNLLKDIDNIKKAKRAI